MTAYSTKGMPKCLCAEMLNDSKWQQGPRKFSYIACASSVKVATVKDLRFSDHDLFSAISYRSRCVAALSYTKIKRMLAELSARH